MKLPNLLVITVPKTGSTSFHKFLSLFNDIETLPYKESWAFDPKKPKVNHQLFEFKTLHLKNNKYLCDFCSYLQPEIDLDTFFFKLLKKAKIIFLFRDPVERTISHYFHEIRIGSEYRSLNEAITLEDEKNYANEDYFSHKAYIGQSKIMLKIKNYIERKNDPNKFLIIDLKNLKKNPSEIQLVIENFLKIKNTAPVRLEHLNYARYKKNIFIFILFNLPLRVIFLFHKLLNKIVPSIIKIKSRSHRQKFFNFFLFLSEKGYKRKKENSVNQKDLNLISNKLFN